MAIPKQPRQIMINIMYLVLTALLALNVSAEIFNAFKVVDNGLVKSNHALDEANVKIPSEVDRLARKNEAELRQYAERTEPARALSSELTEYVDEITDYLIDWSGDRNGQRDEGDYVVRYGVREMKGKKNKDVTTHYLVDEGVGEELKNKILDVRDRFLQLIDEEDRAAFESEISLDIDDETWQHAKDKKSWASFNFRQMPLGATVPILTKIKNDAKSTEAAVLNYLLNKVGGEDIIFDKFQVVSAPRSNYVIRGEAFETEIFLSAFSSNVEDLRVSVGGQSLPVEDGVARFATGTNSTGVKTYTATISFKNPVTGEVTTETADFTYEVGERSANVSLDKMNVFYVGVNNPISVSAAGVSSNELRVDANGGGIQLLPTDKGKYDVTVTQPGATATITLSGGGLEPTNFEYRVKRIPDPVVRLGTLTQRQIGNGTFKAQIGLIPVLENFDFDAKCQILGFQLIRIPRREDPVIEINQGGTFSAQSQRLVNQARPGDRYLFDNVRCKCPGDEVARPAQQLFITIE
jgi:gliding motility-associated protein GldM